MTSSLYTTTYDQITKDFHSSTLIVTIGLSTFVFGLGLSPMFLSPLSEVCLQDYPHPWVLTDMTSFTVDDRFMSSLSVPSSSG